MERPDGWVPDVSPEALAGQRRALREFSEQLERLEHTNRSRSDSVDYLLLRSAVARVRWEVDIQRLHHRNPDFYAQQTLGAVYELLVISSPVTDERIDGIIRRLESIPATLSHARGNLTEAVRPFARVALSSLAGARNRLEAMVDGLRSACPPGRVAALTRAAGVAADAIERFVTWVQVTLPSLPEGSAVGRERYEWFLRYVAMIPLSPEEMIQLGRAEFHRAAMSEALEGVRNNGLPSLPLFATAEAQIEQARQDELAIRRFLEEKDLLTVPPEAGHYRWRRMPPAVEALSGIGMTDDLTSERRLDEDGFAYIPPPSPDLSFFRRACAQDPRPIVIHEGVPGHYFQLSRSWRHDNPIRRRYFDSGANEGWGFYVEEMLLKAGLFDVDRVRGREILYRFMRLRALRVEVDVRLATGEFSIEGAADYLAEAVPMSREEALDEAAFFASTPGQAITYQIGKLQILRFLADARRLQRELFSFRRFHDFIAENGNVPIALQRFELLGLTDDLTRLW
jgi:uncharacterized protein (DUF885 family)